MLLVSHLMTQTLMPNIKSSRKRRWNLYIRLINILLLNGLFFISLIFIKFVVYDLTIINNSDKAQA